MRLDFPINAAIVDETLFRWNPFGCITDVHRQVEGMASKIHQHATAPSGGIIIETGIGASLRCERPLGNGYRSQWTKPIFGDEQSCQNYRGITAPLKSTG